MKNPRIVLILLLLAFCRPASFAQTEELKFLTVFEHGKDGRPDYRIPALVVSKHGTLLAFAEGRQTLSDHAQNDIVLKRSVDEGKTWGYLQVVHEAGSNVLVNPCAVVLDSGRILLMYQCFPAGYHSRSLGTNILRLTPGLKGDAVSLTLLRFSDDDGATWSPPRNVTRQTKRPTEVTSTTSGPGIGIQLQRGRHKGRILIPTSESWWVGDRRSNNATVCFSDDGGKTWRRSQPARDNAGVDSEMQVVELSDGSVLLNARSSHGHQCRKVALSRDGGETWSPLRDEPQLPEPECMGSILRYSWPESGASRILFSNPASTTGRTNGVVRLSLDEGQTWPVSRTIEPGGFAYSCLALLPNGEIGLLFEANDYQQIKFVHFTLGWLRDPGSPPPR